MEVTDVREVQQIEIKSYTKKELRVMYDIKPHQLTKWFKEIETKLQKYGYTPQTRVLKPIQVKIFFEFHGMPTY
jgi:hypothetical protein